MHRGVGLERNELISNIWIWELGLKRNEVIWEEAWTKEERCDMGGALD